MLGLMRQVAGPFFLWFLWFLMMIGSIVGVIIFLIAVWRAMIAHESIADSLRRIAMKQDTQSPSNRPGTEQQPQA